MDTDGIDRTQQLNYSKAFLHAIDFILQQEQIKGGGGLRASTYKESNPHQPKGPLLVLFYDIHFGPNNPKIFLKAPQAPIYTTF